MSSNEIPITVEGKKRLDAELEHMIKVDRESIKKAIQESREHGDLKENSEYHSTRDAQAKLESRIDYLEHIMKTAIVVEKTKGDTVEIGSKIVVSKKGDDEIKTYVLVGAEEADMLIDKLSHISPLGLALVGKKMGDSCEVKTPGGVVIYKIIKVS
mgnify:CR=1 FL=1